MFTKILVATDGSDHGRNATRIAGNLAGRYTSKLFIAHVLTDERVPDELRRMASVEHLVEEPEPERTSSLGRLSLKTGGEANEMRLAAAVSTKLLEQATALAKREGASEITAIELQGDAAHALIKTANEHGIDLVVIGSRGFGAIGRLMHGSVSTKVSHEVRCACLIVK